MSKKFNEFYDNLMKQFETVQSNMLEAEIKFENVTHDATGK